MCYFKLFQCEKLITINKINSSCCSFYDLSMLFIDFFLLLLCIFIASILKGNKPRVMKVMKLNKLTDEELWAKFRDYDDESFSQIYANNSKKLYLYGLKLTTNYTLIEDVIQDLFSDLLRNRRKLGVTNNINFYLLKSFKRLLQRKLQKEKRYNLNENSDPYVFEITYSIEHDIISSETDNLKIQSLRQAMNQLTPRQKEAIYLKFTEELEYGEISEMMDMSIEACRNLIWRAIKSLKESIKGNISVILFYLNSLS